MEHTRSFMKKFTEEKRKPIWAYTLPYLKRSLPFKNNQDTCHCSSSLGKVLATNCTSLPYISSMMHSINRWANNGSEKDLMLFTFYNTSQQISISVSYPPSSFWITRSCFSERSIHAFGQEYVSLFGKKDISHSSWKKKYISLSIELDHLKFFYMPRQWTLLNFFIIL